MHPKSQIQQEILDKFSNMEKNLENSIEEIKKIK